MIEVFAVFAILVFGAALIPFLTDKIAGSKIIRHRHAWKYIRDRDPGSAVMWIVRTCECGAKQEQMRTALDGWGDRHWEDIK